MLWEIRTTSKTPFSIAYGAKPMSTVEVGFPFSYQLYFNEISNDKLRRCELNFLNEKRDDSQLKLAAYQKKMTHYYNAKIKKKDYFGLTWCFGECFYPPRSQG